MLCYRNNSSYWGWSISIWSLHDSSKYIQPGLFLEQLNSGDFVMAWFSGVKEGAGNFSIDTARWVANGSRWSRGEVVSWRVAKIQYYFKTQQQEYSTCFIHSNQPVVQWNNRCVFSNVWSCDHQVTAQVGSEDHAQIWELIDVSGTGSKSSKPQLLFSKHGSFDRNRIILSLRLYPVYYAVEYLHCIVSDLLYWDK